MQIHRQFTDEQVKALLDGYRKGTIEQRTIEHILGIEKTRFFALLKQYRNSREGFSLAYRRKASRRLSKTLEAEMERVLKEEKQLIDDPTLPIKDYNYSAIRDRLLKDGMKVALSTIIERAKALSCYQGCHRKTTHDREVLTTCIGALIQHDASIHRFLAICIRTMGPHYIS
jgi:hypothetical protein